MDVRTQVPIVDLIHRAAFHRLKLAEGINRNLRQRVDSKALLPPFLGYPVTYCSKVIHKRYPRFRSELPRVVLCEAFNRFHRGINALRPQLIGEFGA